MSPAQKASRAVLVQWHPESSRRVMLGPRIQQWGGMSRESPQVLDIPTVMHAFASKSREDLKPRVACKYAHISSTLKSRLAPLHVMDASGFIIIGISLVDRHAAALYAPKILVIDASLHFEWVYARERRWRALRRSFQLPFAHSQRKSHVAASKETLRCGNQIVSLT